MRVIMIGFLLLVMAGCQFNKNEEVVDNHGDIQNIESLDRFVENVKNQKEDQIDFVQYGIEGQRMVRTLTFDGEKMTASSSVDGDFIQEYSCGNILVETNKKTKKYILSDCSGSFNGNFELLSVQLQKKDSTKPVKN
ncbi:DUF4362 domain-containing protein [Bacillus sp. 1P06AnD]|uniref:DUF4362 domain-containing protein n=1 Tax=Bacillus sp. 1P06AnD TaxID=3132208 RepID=UPI00399FDB3A